MTELREPLPDVAYKVLLCPGPLILVRLPLKGRPGRRDYTARWREIVKAAGAVMREHGLRGKDLHCLEHHVSAEDWDPDTNPDTAYPSKVPLAERVAGPRETALRADAAFAGDEQIMPKFYLYDWRDGAFVLVRGPTEAA